MLLGIGVGALAGGAVGRRTSRPAQAFMVVQTLLVLAALYGLASNRRRHRPRRRGTSDFWFNLPPDAARGRTARAAHGAPPIRWGNAMIQHSERAVGGRAGVLYLANTVGAVIGSLTSGTSCCRCSACKGRRRCWRSPPAPTLAPLYLVTGGRVRD